MQIELRAGPGAGGTVLKGARFSLYQVDLDASIAQGKVVAKLDDGCGDNPAYSSDSGVVTFGTSEHPLESSVLYYFVEDSAPAGYEVTNTDPTYVMFCGTGEQAEKDYREAFAKANSLGIKPSAGASFSVFDKKSDTDVTEPSGEATLRVAKLVNAAAPADDAQFDFALTGELGAPMPKDEDGALRRHRVFAGGCRGNLRVPHPRAHRGGRRLDERARRHRDSDGGHRPGRRHARSLHGDVSRRRGRSRVLCGRRGVQQRLRRGVGRLRALRCQDGERRRGARRRAL